MTAAPIDLLSCPACLGALALSPDPLGFFCARCGAKFESRDGVPCFLVPRVKTYFGQQWDLWAKGSFGTEIYGRPPRERFQELLAILRLTESDLGGLRVLDAGCGHGEIAREFARCGATTVGIDVAAEAFRSCARAAQGVGVPPLLLLADYFYCPFRPETFDIVLSSGVAHHTEEPFVALSSILRYVKTGGLVYLYLYEPGRPFYLRLRRLFPFSHTYPKTLRRLIATLLSPIGQLAIRALGRPAPALGTVALGIHDALVPRHAHEIPADRILDLFRQLGFHRADRTGPCEYRAER